MRRSWTLVSKKFNKVFILVLMYIYIPNLLQYSVVDTVPVFINRDCRELKFCNKPTKTKLFSCALLVQIFPLEFVRYVGCSI